jgi:hypothetical protein
MAGSTAMIADNKPNTEAENQSSHATRISGTDLPGKMPPSKTGRRRTEPSEALLRALRAWHSVKSRENPAPAA